MSTLIFLEDNLCIRLSEVWVFNSIDEGEIERMFNGLGIPIKLKLMMVISLNIIYTRMWLKDPMSNLDLGMERNAHICVSPGEKKK